MWIRVSVVGFGAVSYLVAILGGQTLVSLLLGAYGSIAQLLPLAAATFFWPRATKAGAICGILCGVEYNYLIVLKIIPKSLGIHAGIQGLALNIDDFMAQVVRRCGEEVVGKENVLNPGPTMGGEDMAFYLEKSKGCFFFLGVGRENSAPLHNPKFDFNEDILLLGIETYCRIALDLLG